ncbi:uncharacterized protein [Aquarana catesbeiana]|uniref:uncharacterized protein n=1 Tax=Aquarana catesbeiana TaxID=8400 RepID=UPI003CC942AC
MKVVNDKQDDWDMYLEPTLFSLRSKIQTTTKFSPFQLMYGREAVFPAEVPVEMPLLQIILPDETSYVSFMEEKKAAMEIVKAATKENIAKSQNRQKEAHDKKIQKKYKSTIYTVGQKVMVFNMRKKGRKGGRIEPDFNSPCTIEAISGKLVTLLNDAGVPLKNKYNVDHLKPFLTTKNEDKEGDDQSMKTPKGHSSSNTAQQRPSVKSDAAEVPKDNMMITIQFKCYGREKTRHHR